MFPYTFHLITNKQKYVDVYVIIVVMEGILNHYSKQQLIFGNNLFFRHLFMYV